MQRNALQHLHVSASELEQLMLSTNYTLVKGNERNKGSNTREGILDDMGTNNPL